MKSSGKSLFSSTAGSGNRFHGWRHGAALWGAIMMSGAVLLSPAVVQAGKTVDSEAGCAVLPAAIYTGNPFTVKVVRDPAYPGAWTQPTVDVSAVFTKTDGSTVTKTSSETIARYGVTYVNTTMSAPSCNGEPCEIDVLSQNVVITATVTEPINKGKRFRVTVCTPADVPVYQSM